MNRYMRLWLMFFACFLLLSGKTPAQLSESAIIGKLSHNLRPLIARELQSKIYVDLLPYSAVSSTNKSGSEIYGLTIHFSSPEELIKSGIHINSISGSYCTARLTAQEIIKAAGLPSVMSINGDRTELPLNDLARSSTGAKLLHDSYINNTSYKGDGVIVGVFDTGIDWSHLDFRNESDTSKSRILYIWDQSLTAGVGEAAPSGFDYGVEYTQNQINDELDSNPAGFVRERDNNGHGTHVAGSAAGNGSSSSNKKFAGMAPKADIIFVKGGDGSFPTSHIIDALTYFKNKSIALGKPIVVNLSLGSDYGPHDGTDDKSVAMKEFGGAGRIVTAAAGNSGAASIHISGAVSDGDSTDISFIVPSYTPSSGSVNDYFGFDLWLGSNASVTAKVISPNGYIGKKYTGGDTTALTDDGGIYLWNVISTANNNTEIEMDIYDADAAKPPVQGTWKLRLINSSGQTVAFHGWLFRSGIGGQYVTLTNGNTGYTLANAADSTLIVGSYVDRWRWSSNSGSSLSYSGTDFSDDLSSFSSKGPTRDGRNKPDVISPGQGVFSTRSKYVSPSADILAPGAKHYLNQGTSMASPVASGAAALLLQKNPQLFPSQIISLFTSTATSDVYTGTSLPSALWGYGKLDIFSAMGKLFNASLSHARKCYFYDEWGVDNAYSFGTSNKLAVRFTPSVGGKVAGLFFHPSTFAVSGQLKLEIWSDDGSGLPSAKLGSTSAIDSADILNNSWNYASLQDCDISVSQENNYHAVIYFNSGSASSVKIDAGSINSRSSVHNGTSWSAYNSGDFRIRPVVTESPSALPVELLSFQAMKSPKGTILSWSTASEFNNAGWDIERKSGLDANFHKIGFVSGKGSSNVKCTYDFFDSDDYQDRAFYRLKQIDNDGSFTYSRVIAVNGVIPGKFYLHQNYPNPFNPVTEICYEIPELPDALNGGQKSSQGCMISIKFYNMLGQEIGSPIKKQVSAGKHKIEFDGTNLPAGVYIFTLHTDYFSDSKKMILLK